MYYGKYRGKVVNVDDPEKRGRVKVECPSVLGKQISNWALPSLPPFIYYIPPVGSLVWVEFEEGKIDSPIWSGLFYTLEGWAKGAGKFDKELAVIHVPVKSEFKNDKELDIKSAKDTNINSDTKINTKSADSTNITVGSTLNWNQG